MRALIFIFAVICDASAYTDLLATSLSSPPEHKHDLYKFRKFESIADPKFKKFSFGFPAGIYGSSIIPITLWFFHWGKDGDSRKSCIQIIVYHDETNFHFK